MIDIDEDDLTRLIGPKELTMCELARPDTGEDTLEVWIDGWIYDVPVELLASYCDSPDDHETHPTEEPPHADHH